MNIEKTELEGVVTLKLAGWLDTQAAADLQAEIEALDADTQALILDLGELEYTSSAGLRQIVAAHKKVDGRLTLTHVQPEIIDVLEMAGFDKRLHIEA
jgi:anti-anti-sigma factor